MADYKSTVFSVLGNNGVMARSNFGDEPSHFLVFSIMNVLELQIGNNSISNHSSSRLTKGEGDN
jgi:hypothetical protein